MITVWELLPFAGSALLAVLGSRLAHLVSGAVATVTVTAAALVCALATGLVLCSLGTVAVAHLSLLASLGHWSIAALSHRSPVPTVAGWLCGVAGISLLVAALVRAALLLRDAGRSVKACRRMGGDATGLVVLESGQPQAYALAGRPGRIVVSRSLLRALSGPERRALLAHERSHLHRGHTFYAGMIRLAAAANPLLRPLVRTVDVAIERWADADAVDQVRDPKVVIRALAVTGLLARGAAPRAALSATAEISRRLHALATPHQRSANGITAVVLLLATACAVSSLAVGLHVHGIVEWAQARDVVRHSVGSTDR